MKTLLRILKMELPEGLECLVSHDVFKHSDIDATNSHKRRLIYQVVHLTISPRQPVLPSPGKNPRYIPAFIQEIVARLKDSGIGGTGSIELPEELLRAVRQRWPGGGRNFVQSRNSRSVSMQEVLNIDWGNCEC